MLKVFNPFPANKNGLAHSFQKIQKPAPTFGSDVAGTPPGLGDPNSLEAFQTWPTGKGVNRSNHNR